jgi:hypothetical protein
MKAPGVRYALACRFQAMEPSWILNDKLKHIGHQNLFQPCAVGDVLGECRYYRSSFFAE